jgi:hypothetical protein
LLTRKIYDDQLVERVGVAHQYESPIRITTGRSAEIEDAPSPREAADEDSPPVVERRAELCHRDSMGPFRGIDEPLEELAGRDCSALKHPHVRIIVWFAAKKEVEEPPDKLSAREILYQPGLRQHEIVRRSGRECGRGRAALPFESCLSMM